MTDISPATPTPHLIARAQWFAQGLRRRWLFLLGLTLGIWVGMPWLAPVLMRLGSHRAALWIYAIYGMFCHQLPQRSWFLFGEQTNYPRAVFMQLTGVDMNTTAGILAARNFIGDATFGFKTAFCQRDIAIYGAILIFGLIYSIPAVRSRVRAMPIWLWVLIGLMPIALDGFSQLFSEYPYTAIPFIGQMFSFLPERESTPELRTLTGMLFGLSCAWLAFPYLRESFDDMARQLGEKLARVNAAS